MKPWPKAWLALWYAPAIVLAIAVGRQSELIHHHLALALEGPSLAHPLGFDAFGRDLLLTTLRASVLSSAFAALAVVLSLAIGATAGTCLAVAPPAVRFGGLRLLELLLAFPALLFAMAWAAVRGPGWDTLAVALCLTTVPQLARLAYTRTVELASEDFVEAARGLGASPLRIARRHLLPGVLELCKVKLPNLFAGALMAEATLSFLGIGAPIGHDTWGMLLAQGKDYLVEAPHLAVGAGLPLVLTLLSLQSQSQTKKVI